MPTEYAFPYAFDLTEAQFDRLLDLVRARFTSETERAARMAGRPAGSHTPESIEAAIAEARRMAELEAALLVGSGGLTRVEPELDR